MDGVMSNKVAKQKMKELARRNKYGYWTGEYKLDPVPLPNWGSLPWYKRAWKRLTYTALYIFENDLLDPLTFHHPDNYLIRPDLKFKTDMGSVPKFLQGLLPFLFSKDLWLRDFILHDSAYAHKGLWFAKHDLTLFSFSEMKEKQVDNLLALTIKASGGTSISSGPIWLGVCIGGRFSYGKGDLSKRKAA